MTIMPEHNQYQLQQQNASKSSENLRTLLPLPPPPPPPPPAPSSTNKPFAKQMATLCLSNKPSCSRETLALNEDLPATTLINESSGDETGSTCLREVTSSTSRLSPLLLLSFSAEDDDYFIEQSRQKSTKSAIAPSSRPPPAPLDYPSTHTLHPKNTLSSTSQSQQHRRLRQQQQHSVPMQIRSINNKLKKGPAVFNHQQCSRRFYQAKANRSSNKLLPTVYRSTTALVLLFLAVSALLPLTSLVQGMPQTSAVASSYHLKGGPQSARHNHNQHHHHHSHQSTPSSSSPYSLSSSSASSSLSLSSAVQSPPPPQQQGNSYQAHGPHNMYHPFGSSSSISSPSSSVQHHQPLPVKSSSLVQQDSNNNHYHHSSSSALADPPTIVNGSCPTCGRRFDLQQAKDLKLEAIQQQILSKLNLMEKPKVNQNWLKREQALEAIRKAKLNSKIRGRSRSAAISNTGGGGGGGGINSAATNRKRHSRRESDTPVHRRLNFIESQHSSNYNRSSIVLYGNGALEDGTTTTTASAHGNNFDSLFGQDEDEEEEGEEEMESSTDEYYGKTSEIIAFAEPGRTINGHTLVDLTPPHDNLHKLAVTKAVLWARLIYNRTAVRAQFPKRKPVFSAPVTLYIFKVVNKSQQQQAESWASNTVIYPTPFFQRSSEMHQRKTSGRSSSSSSSSANYQQQNSGAAYNESNRLQFSLLTTHRLTKPSRGWTQIDLTAAVADWYAQASSAPFLAREKLTLLIDCVGCNQLLEIDLATGHRPAAQKKNRNNSNNSNNRPQKGSTAGNSRSGSKQSSFQTTSNNITSITSNQTIKSRNYSVGEKTNSQAVTALEAYHHKTPGARKPRRHFQPFVVITTRTKLKRRSRRHAYNCEDGKIKQCCKQSLYVDFSLLGWDDWIIYPKGYTANYCMGECVQLHRSPDVMAYFHSHVIEEYRMKNPYASITPCCAPTKLSSISLIYFDPEGHIIKSDLPKMVVDECGCT